MQPITKAVCSAHAEGKQWTKHLHKFLLNYRTTPHVTTGFSPAELLFNQKIQNKLPQIPLSPPDKGSQVQENDQKAKERLKQYAGKRLRASTSHLKIGSIVLAHQKKQNKLSTKYDPKPFKVVKKKGSMVTLFRNGKYLTRNISHFNVIDSSLDDAYQSADSDDDHELDISTMDVSSPQPPALIQPPSVNLLVLR